MNKMPSIQVSHSKFDNREKFANAAQYDDLAVNPHSLQESECAHDYCRLRSCSVVETISENMQQAGREKGQ